MKGARTHVPMGNLQSEFSSSASFTQPIVTAAYLTTASPTTGSATRKTPPTLGVNPVVTTVAATGPPGGPSTPGVGSNNVRSPVGGINLGSMASPLFPGEKGAWIVKLDASGDVRRLTVTDYLSYNSLTTSVLEDYYVYLSTNEDAVAAKSRKDIILAGQDHIQKGCLRYRDAEGDLCALLTESDFVDAIRGAVSQALLTIKQLHPRSRLPTFEDMIRQKGDGYLPADGYRLTLRLTWFSKREVDYMANGAQSWVGAPQMMLHNISTMPSTSNTPVGFPRIAKPSTLEFVGTAPSFNTTRAASPPQLGVVYQWKTGDGGVTPLAEKHQNVPPPPARGAGAAAVSGSPLRKEQKKTDAKTSKMSLPSAVADTPDHTDREVTGGGDDDDDSLAESAVVVHPVAPDAATLAVNLRTEALRTRLAELHALYRAGRLLMPEYHRRITDVMTELHQCHPPATGVFLNGTGGPSSVVPGLDGVCVAPQISTLPNATSPGTAQPDNLPEPTQTRAPTYPQELSASIINAMLHPDQNPLMQTSVIGDNGKLISIGGGRVPVATGPQVSTVQSVVVPGGKANWVLGVPVDFSAVVNFVKEAASKKVLNQDTVVAVLLSLTGDLQEMFRDEDVAFEVDQKFAGKMDTIGNLVAGPAKVFYKHLQKNKSELPAASMEFLLKTAKLDFSHPAYSSAEEFCAAVASFVSDMRKHLGWETSVSSLRAVMKKVLKDSDESAIQLMEFLGHLMTFVKDPAGTKALNEPCQVCKSPCDMLRFHCADCVHTAYVLCSTCYINRVAHHFPHHSFYAELPLDKVHQIFYRPLKSWLATADDLALPAAQSGAVASGVPLMGECSEGHVNDKSFWPSFVNQDGAAATAAVHGNDSTPSVIPTGLTTMLDETGAPTVMFCSPEPVVTSPVTAKAGKKQIVSTYHTQHWTHTEHGTARVVSPDDGSVQKGQVVSVISGEAVAGTNIRPESRVVTTYTVNAGRNALPQTMSYTAVTEEGPVGGALHAPDGIAAGPYIPTTLSSVMSPDNTVQKLAAKASLRLAGMADQPQVEAKAPPVKEASPRTKVILGSRSAKERAEPEANLRSGMPKASNSETLTSGSGGYEDSSVLKTPTNASETLGDASAKPLASAEKPASTTANQYVSGITDANSYASDEEDNAVFVDSRETAKVEDVAEAAEHVSLVKSKSASITSGESLSENEAVPEEADPMMARRLSDMYSTPTEPEAASSPEDLQRGESAREAKAIVDPQRLNNEVQPSLLLEGEDLESEESVSDDGKLEAEELIEDLPDDIEEDLGEDLGHDLEEHIDTRPALQVATSPDYETRAPMSASQESATAPHKTVPTEQSHQALHYGKQKSANLSSRRDVFDGREQRNQSLGESNRFDRAPAGNRQRNFSQNAGSPPDVRLTQSTTTPWRSAASATGPQRQALQRARIEADRPGSISNRSFIRSNTTSNTRSAPRFNGIASLDAAAEQPSFLQPLQRRNRENRGQTRWR